MVNFPYFKHNVRINRHIKTEYKSWITAVLDEDYGEPFIFPMVEWARERCPHPCPAPQCLWQLESWTWDHKIGRSGTAPTYSSPWQTLHQNWVAQGFRPRGHENKRCYPHFTFAIWWHGRGKKCLPSLHPLLPTEAVRTGPGARRMGKLACPSLAAAHRKTGTMPEQHTSSTLLTGA